MNFSDSGWASYVRSNGIACVGIALGALYWVLESAMDSYVFGYGNFVEQLTSPDANEAWMRLLVGTILGVFGLIAHVLIKERSRAEEDLRVSRQWVSTTLESIGDGVIATDRSGLVTFMNPVAEALTGWDWQDAEGKPLADVFNIIHEETGEKAENCVARVVREGVVVGLANNTALIARDGTIRPILDSGAPIKGPPGAIRGTVLVFRDATETRLAEEALRESEARYRDLYEEAPIAYVATGVDGLITSVNRRACELFGYTRVELVGRPIFDLYADTPSGVGEAQKLFQKFLTGDAFGDVEL
ncbi:MAG: PAS domain S-box protein, partial [SAR202 cluster bacterium]|nr:PAS domain S-box protein [SAR202 cluster bacterium]